MSTWTMADEERFLRKRAAAAWGRGVVYRGDWRRGLKHAIAVARAVVAEEAEGNQEHRDVAAILRILVETRTRVLGPAIHVTHDRYHVG